jgi:DNA polymerase-3 subunit gamma/tau
LHAVFILATTEVHKIPATVLSRCQRHEFRRIPVNDIVAYLTRIAEEEKISIQPGALVLVARQATGAMRDAISLLDQLASTGQEVTLERAHQVLGTATSQAVLGLVEILAARQPAPGLTLIQQALDGGADPRQFARQVVDYLRNLLLMRMGNADQVEFPVEMREKMGRQAQAFTVPELLRMIQAFNQAANEGRGSWLPALPLELAFIESLEEPSPGVQPIEPPAGGKASQALKPSPNPVRPEPALKKAAPPSPVKEVIEEETEPMDPQSAQMLEENWKQILALTRQQNPNTYGLLNSCKSRHLKNNLITLGFASDVLKFQMEKSSNLEVVLGVMREVISQDVEIRCITLTGQRTTPPPGVDSDGMVASALRDLGGEIVDVH